MRNQKEEEKNVSQEEFKEAASICKERNPFMHLCSKLHTKDHKA